MKEPLPKIPRPAKQRWHDIRLRHIPIVAYLAGILGVVYLWNTQWMPSSFTGEVQAPVAEVASPIDGILLEVNVQQYDRVEKGQVIGRITVAPEAAAANLAAIRADLAVMRARMLLDQSRNVQGYEQLRVDQLDQQVNLAVAESRLQFAEAELARTRSMQTQGISSKSELDLAQNERDNLVAEIERRKGLIAEMDSALAAMKSQVGDAANSGILDTINEAIRAQNEQLHQAGDTLLRAPISGLVTKVPLPNGANIRAGDSLITISSEQPEHIIGFVRQPIAFEPKEGDQVVVRTRRNNRQAGEARIIKVGARLEFFTQSLRVRGFDSSQERGLPVLISLPPGLSLHPGELVDLAIHNSTAQGSPSSSPAKL